MSSPGAPRARRDVPAEEEVRAAGRLTGDALAGVVDTVRDVHAEISAVVDLVVPDSVRPWRTVSAIVTQGTYAVVAGAHRVVPRVAAEATALTGRAEAVAPSRSALGRGVLAAVNGIWGQAMAHHEPLVLDMSVRRAGQDVALDADSLRTAFPDATGTVVVFAHGLAETDESWGRARGTADADVVAGDYGTLLQADHAATSVYVRYNSGHPVVDNGSRLCDLLEGLLRAWPVPVDNLVLVGHSMGGLVARSAAHAAADRGASWLQALRLVVALGSPHLGAPLARGVDLGHEALSRTRVTAPLARLLRLRSHGVDDLRHGGLGGEPLAPESADALSHVRFCSVSASVTDDPDHPVGRLLGDGLVQVHSASTAPDGTPIPQARHLGGTGHVALLNHAEVARQLSSWVGEVLR